MKYPLFATLKELLIEQPNQLPIEIADKLYQYHIMPMHQVRVHLDTWITASLKSGYRSEKWEKKQGRSGKSQHTFIDEWINGSGAIDWTCGNFEANKTLMLNLILTHTNYTRMCIYNSFIHCDYKDTASGKREVYTSGSNSQWKFVRYSN